MSVVAVAAEPIVRLIGLFDTKEEARAAGADVAIETPDDVDAHWPPDEVPDLVRAAGDEDLASRLEVALRGAVGERASRRVLSPWLGEVRAALERGATSMANAGSRPASGKSAKNGTKGASAKGAGAKAATKGAAARAGRKANIPDDAIIRFGTNQEKQPYGAANNPMRKGSSSAQRFAKIRDGMTFKEYRDKIGGKYAGGDVAWYEKRGYVRVERPKPAVGPGTAGAGATV